MQKTSMTGRFWITAYFAEGAPGPVPEKLKERCNKLVNTGEPLEN